MADFQDMSPYIYTTVALVALNIGLSVLKYIATKYHMTAVTTELAKISTMIKSSITNEIQVVESKTTNPVVKEVENAVKAVVNSV